MASDDRILDEWHFDKGYSYTRTHDALQAFKSAEQQEDILKNIAVEQEARPKRAAARLPKLSDRRKGPASPGPREDDDDDEGDGAYNPRICSDQMKNLGCPNSKNKRKADGASRGESPKKNAKTVDGDNEGDDEVERTGLQSKEERLLEKTAFITLGFTSDRALEIQKQLAAKHANDVSMVPPPKNHDRRTYNEKLDEEAAHVPNETGRALRSGKIVEEIKSTDQRPNNELSNNEHPNDEDRDEVEPWTPPVAPCPACRRRKTDCICHEALIEKQKEGGQTRVPSVLPLTHRRSEPRPVPIAASRTPSRTGKDREPTRSASPMTPSPSTSHYSQPSRLFLTPRSRILTPSSTSSSLSSDARQQSTGARDDPITLDDDDDDDGDEDGKSVNMCAEEIEIRTPWSHPINFRHTSSGSTGIPCKFCGDFRYGIWGEVQRAVVVIKDPSSERHQFLEIVGDPKHPAPPQTLMCVFCALSRLYILSCPGHHFEAMPTISVTLATEAMKQVLLQKGPAIPKPAVPLCSLCIRPARIKCCASQKFSKTRRPQIEPNTLGCGLLLCSQCHRVVNSSSGKLRKHEFLRYEREANEVRPMSIKLRAEAEFLFDDSLLQKAYASPRKA